MFGIGSTELLVILVVALVVLGPKSLPGIAKTVGKVMGEFRRVTTDFQRTMNAEVAQEEHEKRKKEAEEEFFSKGEDDTKNAANAQRSTEAASKVAEAKNTAQDASSTPPVSEPSVPAAEVEVTVDASTAKTVQSPIEEAVSKAQKEAAEDTQKVANGAAPAKEMA